MEQTLKRVKKLSEYRPVSEKEYLKAIKLALESVQKQLLTSKGTSRKRINAIIAQLKEELKSPTRKFIESFFKDMVNAIWLDTKGIKAPSDEWYTLSKDDVTNLMSFKEIYFTSRLKDGSEKTYLLSVDELLKSVHKDIVKRVKSTVTSGMVTGVHTNDIVREIGYINGIEKRHLRTVVRTMFADAQNRTQMAMLKANQDIYSSYEYVAKLDNRTTEICRHLDETRWEKLDDIPEYYIPILHINCRSIIVGIIE